MLSFSKGKLIFKLGCGNEVHTPDKAMDYFLQREFPTIFSYNEEPHEPVFIPDVYIYGKLASQVHLNS